MKKFKQVISLTITAVLILTVTSGCKSDTSAAAEIVKSPFASFRDIPDITAEEIEAVESFAAQNRTFKYGVLPTTEFFVNENGEFGGYSVLLCEWLSELFGIEFKAGLYQLDDLLDKLEKHEVDFAGSLSSAGSLENTFRTEPIATRKGVMVRIKGSLAISEIEQTRLPRYTFLRGMASQRILSEAFENGSYDDFPVENHLQAYDAIKSGVADAYIAQNVTEEFFSEYGDVYIEDFFPLVFTPVYIIAANPELEPFISVINKSLQNGAEPYLKTLYNQGYDEYKRSKFLKTLSPEEREYLQSPAPVPLAASYYNYPISYYNEYESQWEGITFEILSEIEKHTGLTFEVVNDKKTPLSELLEMLGDGRASMISDLISTVEREERFLLPDYKIITDQCALLSKTTYPNVSVNEINSEKIGLIKDSVHADLFRIWFPKAENTVVYDTADSAVYALDSGEVNLVMSSKSNLLSFLNYYELSDYKANYLFSYNYESSFGFAKDEVLLCSIVDKALAFIDTYMITEQWTTKTYDYHLKMMETQRPWMIGAIAMFSLIIVLILLVLFRSRSEEIRLSRLVKEKTSTLTAILDATPDLIFCQDLDSRTIECNKAFENFFCVNKEEIVGKNDVEAFGWTPEKMEWHLNWNKKVFDEKTTVVIEEEFLSP
ncbi:MAG: transporter substrate-binding domain-containing protein, partial [Oscillospiraceae bacterium]|nr:transporter substrate-binding domain-containing protein [Oscillospiraceae bacterium]